VLVDRAGQPQGGARRLEVAVQIADGHHAVSRGMTDELLGTP
jgi:hypothetical protein